jgi:murein DD-endopeptidase MepM/ murein hydrolase activator NlpD
MIGHRSIRLLASSIAMACLWSFAASAASANATSAQTRELESALRSGGFYAGPSTLLRSDRQLARNRLGGATLHVGDAGFAVRELQLALAWQGFPSGTIDGGFGSSVAGALRRFQRAEGLRPDGVAGASTMARLRVSPRLPAMPLGWPVLAPIGDRFGPRGDRFHAGVDLLSDAGTPIIAAAAGRVVFAGWRAGGWGKLVTIAHAGHVRTLYAHLSAVDVRVGEWVAGGTVLGRVGATGDATGPHLHFEVRLNGAAIDPLRVLVKIPGER